MKPDEKQLKQALAAIERRGFPYMKLEIEGNTGRGRQYDSDALRAFYFDDAYCEHFIQDHVSQEARDALVYLRVYNDYSVDTEATLTLPTAKAYLFPEFIRAFKQIGLTNDRNAGLHIAVLTTSKYPCTKSLDRDKVDNFKTEVTKLIPALYAVASSNYKSRPLRYRLPKIYIGTDHGSPRYAAINVNRMSGYMEYRVFEPCFDDPTAVLEYFTPIANTLKYYGVAKNKVSFKDFKFPLNAPNKEVLGRFYITADQIKALDDGLKVLVPGISIAKFKKMRGIVYKPGKAEAKLQAGYDDYMADYNKRLRERLHLKFKSLTLTPEQRKLYGVVTLDSKQAQSVVKDIKRELANMYSPRSMAAYKAQHEGDYTTITTESEAL